MRFKTFNITLLALGALAASACSKTGQSTGAAPTDTAASSKTAEKPGNACARKLLTAEDAAGFLGQPVTGTKDISGDAQSCEFVAGNGSTLTVAVRPGHGIAAVGMYTSGKMDEFDKAKPLSGVGDEAVRSLSLQRVIARKGDLLCEITGPGLARQDDEATPQKLGALCNKVFAGY